MPEAVRYGNAGCVVHGPRGLRTRVTALFSGASSGRADLAAAAPGGGAGRRPVPPILCPATRRSVIRLPSPRRPATPRQPAAFGPGTPNTPRPAGPRERTGAAVRRKLCARRDWNPRTQPSVLSQLPVRTEPFTEWPESPPPTRQERTARYAFTRRGRATFVKGTSLCTSRVERFVIERFTPRVLIDLTPVGEGVPAGPRDAVDSILKIGGWGTVRNRGETCRSGRPVRTRETRTPRGA